MATHLHQNHLRYYLIVAAFPNYAPITSHSGVGHCFKHDGSSCYLSHLAPCMSMTHEQSAAITCANTEMACAHAHNQFEAMLTMSYCPGRTWAEAASRATAYTHPMSESLCHHDAFATTFERGPQSHCEDRRHDHHDRQQSCHDLAYCALQAELVASMRLHPSTELVLTHPALHPHAILQGPSTGRELAYVL